MDVKLTISFNCFLVQSSQLVSRQSLKKMRWPGAFSRSSHWLVSFRHGSGVCTRVRSFPKIISSLQFLRLEVLGQAEKLNQTSINPPIIIKTITRHRRSFVRLPTKSLALLFGERWRQREGLSIKYQCTLMQFFRVVEEKTNKRRKVSPKRWTAVISNVSFGCFLKVHIVTGLGNKETHSIIMPAEFQLSILWIDTRRSKKPPPKIVLIGVFYSFASGPLHSLPSIKQPMPLIQRSS